MYVGSAAASATAAAPRAVVQKNARARLMVRLLPSGCPEGDYRPAIPALQHRTSSRMLLHPVVRMTRSAAGFALALLTVGLVDLRPRAMATPCEFENVDRIVAIGDVHGAFERFMEILQTAEIVDRNGRWSGGKTHLVQLGDVLDRGPDSRKAFDLLARLEREAASAGGRVHSLIGN